MKKRLIRICDQHGLKLTDDAGKRLQGEDGNAAIQRFAASKLRTLIRRKDGKPVDDQTIESILIWVDLKQAEDKQGEQKESPLEDVTKDILKQKYGGEKKFQNRTALLMSRIFGLTDT